MTIETGTQLGIYRLDALLGQGGMAEVYKAWHTGLHRYEALKLLPPQMTYDHSFVERFLNEARTAAGLRHPNIATIYTVSGADEAQPYFTMEVVEGCDLSDLLHQMGRVPIDVALPILTQVASALDYAHAKGFIHRDVKPGNVLLENTSHGWNAKVVDFGIARAQESNDGARLTKTGMIVGTPEYMAPEQAGSGPTVGPQSDQYALGVIAYEMICGRPPFLSGPDTTAITVIMSHIRDTPTPAVTVDPNVPVAMSDAIVRCLAKDPAQRFVSCADFVAAMSGEKVAAVVAASPAPATNNASTTTASPTGGVKMLVPLALVAVLGIGLVLAHFVRNNAPAPGTGSPPTAGPSGNGTYYPPPPPPAPAKIPIPNAGGPTPKVAGPVGTTTSPVSTSSPAPSFEVHDMPTTANVGRPFEFDVDALNRGIPVDSGSITTSFTKSPHVQLSSDGADPNVWGPGKKIGSFDIRSNKFVGTIAAPEVGAEAYYDRQTWGSGGKRTARFTVTPLESGPMVITIRCTLTLDPVTARRENSPRFYTSPSKDETNGVDQQGCPAKSYTVEVN